MIAPPAQPKYVARGDSAPVRKLLRVMVKHGIDPKEVEEL